MKKLALVFLLLLWGCQSKAPETPVEQDTTVNQPMLPATPGLAPSPTPVEKIKETKMVKGIFRGFNGDEGFKAVIELAEDQSLDELRLSGEDILNFFLAANLDKPLEFTYKVVEGASGTGTIDTMIRAKAGELTQEAWWQKEKAGNPDEAALRKKYAALVEQATEKDNDAP